MRRKQPANSPRQQRGIAILTTLVIAVLVVTLAAVIFARQSRAVRQTDNYQSLERAWQYAYSIEQFAGMELVRDAKSSKHDDLTEDWAINLPTLPLEEGNGVKVGEFTATLEDLQGRYNINNVLDEKGKLRTNGEDQHLKKLAQSAGLPDAFISTIIDWMDPDSIIQSGDSAETDYYLSGTIPYRAADMPMADASELRLLRLDMEPEQKDKALNAFLQNVTVLPFKTTVNANTASAAVLQAMGLSTDRIKTIMDRRNPDNEKPFTSSNDLLGALTFNPQDKADAALEKQLRETLDVSSSYFRLKGEIKLGRARVHLNSVFYREPGKPIRVIMRQFDRVNDQPATTTTDDASNTLTDS
ncbi:MAG: type II secretion system minor pseudopilin GspK [Gammaproteobacteria bacterium]|nr:type II secretion system minor pseudopilin GspK [Gammaproteobacteria bacterium]MBU1724312.1 type II secretion system minor pseudopilin GspK [Gammaproteobacteria bacterium]MBU2006260.1 type II secretion system minor pseudopilin GspK [Gammaproteobacteria bacterium]